MWHVSYVRVISAACCDSLLLAGRQCLGKRACSCDCCGRDCGVHHCAVDGNSKHLDLFITRMSSCQDTDRQISRKHNSRNSPDDQACATPLSSLQQGDATPPDRAFLRGFLPFSSQDLRGARIWQFNRERNLVSCPDDCTAPMSRFAIVVLIVLLEAEQQKRVRC